MTLEWTGERFLPCIGDPVVAYEHMHRYAYASQFVRDKCVLDLASGEGFGSALLARTARSVVGIDIDKAAVEYARRKYMLGNLQFIAGSIAEVPVLSSRCDVIVCFEAVEHIHDQDKLLREVKRLLVSDGLLLISTPNRPEYRALEPSNPFHVKELDFEEFHALLAQQFKHLQFLGQRVCGNSNVWPIPHNKLGRISEFLVERGPNEYVFADADKRIPMYFIGVASNADALPVIEGAVLADSSDELLKERDRIERELELALKWREEQVRECQDTIRSREQALEWREEQVRQCQDTIRSREQALGWREDQVRECQDTIRSQEAALIWRETQVNDLLQATEIQTGMIRARDQSIAETKEALGQVTGQLHAIQSGRSYRLIQKFIRMRDRILPAGSIRRRVYNRLVRQINP